MATEGGLNFLDGASRTLDWTITDDPGNNRFNIQPVIPSLGCAVIKNAHQTIPGGLSTIVVTFPTKIYDTDGMVAGTIGPVTPVSFVTVNTAGVWLLQAEVWFDGFHNPQAVGCSMSRNGFTLNNTVQQSAIVDTISGGAVNTTGLQRLSAGDQIGLAAYHNEPNPLDVSFAYLAAQRIGTS